MKTKTHKTQLEARVALVNKVNAKINEMAPLYREAAKAFFGKPTHKADGCVFAKVKAALPSVDLTGFQSWSPRKGCFVVKASSCYGKADGYNTADYYEQYFYAWTNDRNGLAEPLQHEFVPYRTDWTLAEVKEKKAKAEAAREAVRQAEREVVPFANAY